MARLGMIINDADLNGGYAFNDPVFQEKDRKEAALFIKRLAVKAKYFLDHGHSPMEGEKF
jgi:hypothetical protein